MALLRIPGVRLAAVSVTVPERRESNFDCDAIPENERALFVKTTGIEFRRIAPPGMLASDLCYEAAVRLIENSGIVSQEIGAIVFVTQTPDFLMPGNATIVQQKLGASRECMCLDVNQGCAGYVYGLSVAASLVSSGCENVLLLVGDTLSKAVSESDKSTRPIFSDAGSATLLIRDESAQPMWFHLGADGSGSQVIRQDGGGWRNSFGEHSSEKKEHTPGVNFSDLHMHMNGMEVFSFSVERAPESIRKLMTFSGKNISDADHFVFHQANLLMNETIRRRLEIPVEKVPYSLRAYGNTSCATLPVTMTASLGGKLRNGPNSLVLCGFGIGLSWASAWIQTENVNCLPVSEI